MLLDPHTDLWYGQSRHYYLHFTHGVTGEMAYLRPCCWHHEAACHHTECFSLFRDASGSRNLTGMDTPSQTPAGIWLQPYCGVCALFTQSDWTPRTPAPFIYLLTSSTYITVTADHSVPKLTLLALGASGGDIQLTNSTKLFWQTSAIQSADFLPVLLPGQPVFRKVHAREHPIPSTIITIAGTHFITVLENHSLIAFKGSFGLSTLKWHSSPPLPLKHCYTMPWLLCSWGYDESATRHHISPGRDAWWRGKHGPTEKIESNSLSSFSILQISCKSRFFNMGLSLQMSWNVFKSKLSLFPESAFPSARQHDVRQICTADSTSVGFLQRGTLTGWLKDDKAIPDRLYD